MTPRNPLVALAALLCSSSALAGTPNPPPIKGPGCGGLTGSVVAGAVAESLVMAAAAKSEAALAEVKNTPIEFAVATVVFAYGSETLPDYRNPDKKMALAIIEEKAGYWKVVSESLGKEQEKLEKELKESGGKSGDESWKEAPGKMKRSRKLLELKAAADAISADVSADKAKVEGGKESNQELLDRKAALWKKLAALNPPAKKKP
jgi:hypothetical protein